MIILHGMTEIPQKPRVSENPFLHASENDSIKNWKL